MKNNLPKALIMLVDDEPENLNVLSGMFGGEEWSVCAFPRGEMALAAAQEVLPDLILMDIRMPGMDGYETCRRFKKDLQLKDIPVIFLSALTDSKDKVEAFKAGGVDYITKPFYEAEVLARVRTHLDLRSHRLHLEELVRRRSEELASACRRLRIWDDAKTQWLNLLSHEMRTPLTGIIGTAEVLFSELTSRSELHELHEGYEQSVYRINKLIDDAMLLTQIDVASSEFSIKQVSCNELLRLAIQALDATMPGKNVRITALAESDCMMAEPVLLGRAFADLLRAAACCIHIHEEIQISSASLDKTLIIQIATSGQPLPESDMASFFDIGGQRTLLIGGGDFGLGPALARRIIQLYEGRCSVRNGAEKGVLLEVQLPLTA